MTTAKPLTEQPFLHGLPFVRSDKAGNVLVTIQVKPNAQKTECDGLHDDGQNIALKLRLQALPVDGKANDALVKWLAGQLGISRSDIAVLRGKTSRRKQVLVAQAAAGKADWGHLALRIRL
jgi:uncharacterized protein (TIGR00251 family)